jgi:hypothetical protein
MGGRLRELFVLNVLKNRKIRTGGNIKLQKIKANMGEIADP